MAMLKPEGTFSIPEENDKLNFLHSYIPIMKFFV